MSQTMTRRGFVGAGAASVATGLLRRESVAGSEPSDVLTMDTPQFRYVIGDDGRNLEFTDKQTGINVLKTPSSCAEVRQGGKWYPATAIQAQGQQFDVQFAGTDVKVSLCWSVLGQHCVVEVLNVSGGAAEQLAFVNVPLTLRGEPDESFAATALALNLQANVIELPRASRHLRALCYADLGMVKAKAAVVAAPHAKLRKVLQEAVTAAPDLPHSSLGGPWALDQAINRGSYLFNFDGITEKNVDQWIELAKSVGLNQIDFHGGQSFRFGDFRPHPDLYPQGRASLKAVIDRLHSAGLAAGLHTYAFFIAKTCPWVTPQADARLLKSRRFTLAERLSATDARVPVTESTKDVSTITGFFVRNSVTLRIGEELVVFKGVAQEPPFAFTECQRGAYGTKAAEHPDGCPVDHLKECFGLFAPDPDSTLFTEVAALTAETFNECGFDMMYLDALDGSDVLDPFQGRAYAWHYGARFVYEIWKRLKRPALMEMSTFHHHLWCVRSRYCAWDHPNRSYKRFVDLHCADNEKNRRMFLPGELGWWALKSWTGSQIEPTYADDIEYLMVKALATDTGFALMGIDPRNAKTIPALPRLGAIIRRYEDLRHQRTVPDSIKRHLQTPGKEFTLVEQADGVQAFCPIEYVPRRVDISGGQAETWTIKNSFEPQPLRMRIQALMAAGPYEAEESITLADFQMAEDFPSRASQSGVQVKLEQSREVVQARKASGRLVALSTHANPKAAWAKLEKTFAPVLDLSKHQALGLWVHGDGEGQILNLQLRSPQHVVHAISEHYISIDFKGWRYVELLEPEGARYAEYVWPYGDIYSIYRESVQFAQIASLGLWLNNLPAGKEVSCYLSPIKALPAVATRIVSPSLTIGGRTLVLPVEIASGCYLELQSSRDCKLYGPQGELIRDVTVQGEVPLLESGENAVTFRCDSPAGLRARAHVTIISSGPPVTASVG